MTEKAILRAKELFAGNYNCAQSVMKSILTEKDLDFKQATELTAGLGAGIAHEGNVCGAVSGAIAAIGVINGKHYHDVLKHKDATYASAEDFVAKFKKRHGSILCNTLTGIEMADTNIRSKAMKEGLFGKLCPKYVESAVEIALEISRQ